MLLFCDEKECFIKEKQVDMPLSTQHFWITLLEALEFSIILALCFKQIF